MKSGPVVVEGLGLAGSAVCWELSEAGLPFAWRHMEWGGASSRVAAGLVNPVTGRNFEPAWRFIEFLAAAKRMYAHVGALTGRKIWHPMEVVRFVDEGSWPKVASKLEAGVMARWVVRVDEQVSGWRAAVTLKHGGRVDVAGFCEVTRKYFSSHRVTAEAGTDELKIRCEGAKGLIDGRLGRHRCAKGEILTLRVPGGDEGKVLIGGGGWLVPVGDGLFKAGATYEWEELDGRPTEAGRSWVEAMLRRMGLSDFEIVGHEAAVRPIVRRSIPVIGGMRDGHLVFNGLGSKGSLYAPGSARQLVDWLAEGKPIDPELEVGRFLSGSGSE